MSISYDLLEIGELVQVWGKGPQMRVMRLDRSMATCERLLDGERNEIPLAWLRRPGE